MAPSAFSTSKQIIFILERASEPMSLDRIEGIMTTARESIRGRLSTLTRAGVLKKEGEPPNAVYSLSDEYRAEMEIDQKESNNNKEPTEEVVI